MNKNSNNWEKSFHKKLHTYQDVPSMNMWSKIEERIPEPPQSANRKFIWAWTSAAAACIIFALGIFQTTQMVLSPKTNTTALNERPIINKDRQHYIQDAVSPSLASINIETNAMNVGQSNIIENQNIDNKINDNKNTIHQTSEIKDEILVENKISNTLQKIEEVEVKALDTALDITELEIQGQLAQGKEVPSKNWSLKVGVRPSLVLSDEHKNGLAMNAGLKVERRINKGISLLSGIEYRRTYQEIGNMETMAYSMDDEILQSDGSYTQEMNHTYLAKSGESFDFPILSSRIADVPMEEMDDVDFMLQGDLVSHSIDIPIGMVYHIPLKKLKLRAKAGLVGNIQLQKALNIHDLKCQNQSIVLKNTLASVVNKDTKVNLRYFTGLGVEWAMNQHLSAYVEPTFEGRVLKRTQQDNPLNVGLEAGLAYRF